MMEWAADLVCWLTVIILLVAFGGLAYDEWRINRLKRRHTGE